MGKKMTAALIAAYGRSLRGRERSPGTVEKYLRDIGAFSRWLGGGTVSGETAARWKAHLLEQGYAPATVNSMLAAVNGLFRFLGWEDCRTRSLRLQRRMFREPGRELTRADYERLLQAARGQGRERLELLMETLCATGIRVSELGYITVEAAKRRRAEISLKGKIRVILLPGKLSRKLLSYAARQKTASGAIFRTGRGPAAPPPPQARPSASMRAAAGSSTECQVSSFASPGCSTRPAGTSPSWRTCWATRPWRRRGSTLRTPARST